MRHGRRASIGTFAVSLSDISQAAKAVISNNATQQWIKDHGAFSGQAPPALQRAIVSQIVAAGGIATLVIDAQGKMQVSTPDAPVTGRPATAADFGSSASGSSTGIVASAVAWTKANAWYVGGGVIIAGGLALALRKRKKMGRHAGRGR